MRGVKARLGLGLAVALVAFVLDVASKAWILDLMRPPGVEETPFIGVGRFAVLPFLDFVLAWNRGVSFGVGNTDGGWNVWVFTAIALVVGTVLIRTMTQTRERWLLIAQGLIVGGAAGNVLDRLRHGAVVDFLYVHIGAFDWWPAFNLADSAIFVGAAIWILQSLFAGRESHKNTP